MSTNDAPAVKPSLLTLDAALSQLLAAVRALHETETMSALHANGHVLMQAVCSSLNVPPADNTQMNGYTMRTTGAAAPGTRLKVAQHISAGHVGQPLNAGEAARIFTGTLIPLGADVVIMQEQCKVDPNSGTATINHAPESGEWIRRVGKDIVDGTRILPHGTCLGPQQLGLAASVDYASLHVIRRPRVAVFFISNELAMPDGPLKPGAIYNSNRFTLRTLPENLGRDITDFGIVPDTLQAACDILCEAAGAHDLIITSGGVSMGEGDHIEPAVEARGHLNLWQIAIRPGKPLAFGEVRRPEGMVGGPAAFFTGPPGNPVSSLVTSLLFVRPFILRLQGVQDVTPKRIPMRADFALPKGDRRNEFLRARISAGGGLDLFPNQSSGVLTSTVWGSGLINNSPNQPITPGDVVSFLPPAGLV